jgi:hypothetical protein
MLQSLRALLSSDAPSPNSKSSSLSSTDAFSSIIVPIEAALKMRRDFRGLAGLAQRHCGQT